MPYGKGFFASCESLRAGVKQAFNPVKATIMTDSYQQNATNLEQIQPSQGFLLLEFGTNWCGHCMAAKPLIQQALNDYPHVQHIKEEDGAGRRLGRYFSVKLWPTLILLKNGEELGRVIRPTDVKAVQELLALAS